MSVIYYSLSNSILLKHILSMGLLLWIMDYGFVLFMST